MPAPSGTDGETRTHTAFATAPSRRRVYQFHHVGSSRDRLTHALRAINLSNPELEVSGMFLRAPEAVSTSWAPGSCAVAWHSE